MLEFTYDSLMDFIVNTYHLNLLDEHKGVHLDKLRFYACYKHGTDKMLVKKHAISELEHKISSTNPNAVKIYPHKGDFGIWYDVDLYRT